MSSRKCKSLETVVSELQRDGVVFALVHESALMGWGIDNNVFLDTVDVFLEDESGFGILGSGSVPSNLGECAQVEVTGVPVRLWSRASLGLSSPFDVTECKRYGCDALAPEIVLRKLPYSPDARLLDEQRARLAAIVNVDSLTDDELILFARYVRGE